MATDEFLAKEFTIFVSSEKLLIEILSRPDLRSWNASDASDGDKVLARCVDRDFGAILWVSSSFPHEQTVDVIKWSRGLLDGELILSGSSEWDPPPDVEDVWFSGLCAAVPSAVGRAYFLTGTTDVPGRETIPLSPATELEAPMTDRLGCPFVIRFDEAPQLNL